MAVLVIAGIAARRWWQMGSLPTGLDGGQWLALGRGLTGEGRSTSGAYPPLVPSLAALWQAVGPPELGLKLIAVGSLLAILLMIYLVARDGLGAWLGLAVVATIGPASTVTEPMAFGGYPQQLAFAFLLLAAWGLARYLAAGTTGWLVAAGGGLVGAALTHHIYFPLTLVVAGLVWLLWLLIRNPGDLQATATSALGPCPEGAHPNPGGERKTSTRGFRITNPGRDLLVRRSLAALALVAVSLAVFAPTALDFLATGYAPPLDGSGMDVGAAFQYGTREAVWPWLAITAAGIASLVLSGAALRRFPAWQVAVALVVAAGGPLALTGESRLLPPFLAGATLGLGAGWRWLSDRLGATRLAWLPLVAALALPAALWFPADREAGGYFAYYRVLDEPMLGAAAAIAAADPAGLVAVRQDWRGWPVGWWFEGLTSARIAVGSDPRWLGFPEELARAEMVDRFFAQRLAGPDLIALANETGVELIALRKWEWIGWQRWLEADPAPVEVVYDDDIFLVLRIVR